ncbi:YcaO-like family protein [Streptomyces sp. MAR4 CNX-425]|uniref:YcaO-like family protein n=1 Tax=Streptomyces sp. MAR4 CNX-425 TaxID=3406343 RepID=UPI003B50D4CB
MTEFADALAARLEKLVSPYGVISGVSSAVQLRGFGSLSLAAGQVGAAPGIQQPEEFNGSGRAMGRPDLARLIAIAEAAERYSGADFLCELDVPAREAELDGPVLDMTALPRCSPREYESGHCPVSTYHPEESIRWLRGLELVSGHDMWVPAVMARYGRRRVLEAEAFWHRISTGYAVHSDPAEAVLRGLCEVAERDAAALTWLQMLPLPPVRFRSPGGELATLLEACARQFVETLFFDATTDVGVPTVCCLQLAEHDEWCAQSMTVATGRSLADAAAKSLLESITGRALHHRPDRDGYSLIMAGADELGARERRHAFGFLLEHKDGSAQGEPRRREDGPVLAEDAREALRHLVGGFAARGQQVVAVDRTTSELREAGLTAVCVIVPALQPLTFHRYGQYRAHPRLYAAPKQMGFPSRPEEELNPWPVPYV